MTPTPTYRIRPLVWADHATQHYTGHRVETLFGAYVVYARTEADGTRFSASFDDGSVSQYLDCDSIESGKAACEAHWAAQLAQVLEVVELTQCTDRAHAHFQSRLGECFSALEAIMRLPSDAPINHAQAIAQRSLGYSDATVAGIEKAKGDQ